MHNEDIVELLKKLHFNGMISQFNEMIEVAEIKKLSGIQLMVSVQPLCLTIASNDKLTQ
jgi:hypothetical protein